MSNLAELIENDIPKIRQKILEAFKENQSSASLSSVWEYFEQKIVNILKDYLSADPFNIPDNNFFPAKSKSVYPDLKIEYEGKYYAFDVKSGEYGRDPWYDMGRIDEYENKHLAIYAAEFYVTVCWSGRDTKVVQDIFVEPAYKSAGYRAESKGVLYRPYDGKIRPKPWSYFREAKSFWQDLEHFKTGLNASKAYRRRSYILNWYKEMTPHQRQQLDDDLAQLKAGESVVTEPLESESES